MKINDVIRTRRQALGLTQEALAERLGVSGPAVNKWEKSLNYPDITLLPTLARVLGVDLNTLLSFQEDMDRGEIGPYYTPLKTDKTPAKFLKAKPLTDWSKCCQCGACARACPMGSIDPKTMEAVGLCIKCQACVRKCTRHAKFFEDPDFLSHVAMLEENYTRRAENFILV